MGIVETQDKTQLVFQNGYVCSSWKESVSRNQPGAFSSSMRFSRFWKRARDEHATNRESQQDGNPIGFENLSLEQTNEE